MTKDEMDIRDFGLVFGVTCTERERLSYAKFMQKREILSEIKKMKWSGILRVKDFVHFNGDFHKKESNYVIPRDIDQFASDMMDWSISYAILWLDRDIIGFNEIAIARTAHHTTNIDADIIGALIDKMRKLDC